ncbi:MlaD family protein [Nocardioides daeguensis]|uniref:Mce/MlaD domain-containing protein n=1 Tax=Nocardioides daeguensis TaxID=908359 RepID=A0ABP6UZV2_9ACTN|nr:MlaD family protein [Nocardioides daeguensis]MBV6728787.1 MCE family protein [Nocardioides daeguensis]MCR1773603.1 MCE family protein [Nocardioides daeguensis]
MSTTVTPELRNRAFAFRAGLIVLAAIAILVYITFKAQTGMPFRATTTVKARIADVHSLKVNDAVRQHSSRIGRVSAIDYVDGAALVTMELDGDVDVYRDASAAIWDLSALATKFVELDPGTASSGALGSTPIGLDRTVESSDLYEILDVLDEPTRAQATSTLREVGGGMAGHGQDLAAFLASAPDVLRDLGAVSASLSSKDADLPQLLAEAQTLAGRFEGREDELAGLVDQTAQTLSAVSVDDATPLHDTLLRLPRALSTTRRAMDDLRRPLANTRKAVTALEPGGVALARSERDLRSFLRDSVPVAHQVPAVADQAVPAVKSLAGAMADARPLAPPAAQAVNDLMTPLRVLAPYASDMASLFLRGASFVSQGPNPGVRYARLGVSPGVNTLTGGLISSRDLPQNQYPKPGEAENDRAKGLLPVGLQFGLVK